MGQGNSYRQVLLKSGYSELVCWLPDSPNLKVGTDITLKDHEDPDRWWEIKFVGKGTTDKSKLNRTWSNNI